MVDTPVSPGALTMEVLFALLLTLVAATSLIASPILALIALNRSKQVPLLQRRVRELEQRLARGGPGARPPAAAPPPTVRPPSLTPEAEGSPSTGLRAATEAATTAGVVESEGRPVPHCDPEAAERATGEAAAHPPRDDAAEASPAALPFRREAEPAAPATPRHRPPAPRASIEWERWIGVRGAAAVGAVLFALAGLLFFKHALEQGWLGPPARVAIGSAVGLVAIAAGEVLRRRDYRHAPAGVAGAGIVVLFATTWASYARYGFLPSYVALGVMAALTAACAALSVRHRSQGVAVLGLVGGFAAPILLSMQAQSPATLFGYLLLLDLGLLALGSRQRWSLLGTLAALGTIVVQGVWVLGAMRPEDTPFALFSLGALALVLAIGASASRETERGRWLVTQASALLLPFGFAIYFASQVHFGDELWPLAGFAAVLTAGAAWTCRREPQDWLLRGAATGAVALLTTWAAQRGLARLPELEFSLCALGLGALHLGIGLAKRRVQGAPVPAPSPFAVFGLGTLLLCASAAPALPAATALGGVPLAWIALCLGLLVLLSVELEVDGRLALGLRIVLAVVAGVALGTRALPGLLESVEETRALGLVAVLWRIGAVVAFTAFTAWRLRRDPARTTEAHAAGAFALMLLLTLPTTASVALGDPRVVLPAIAALALLTALPATALRRGLWQAVACGAFAFASVRFVDVHGWEPRGEPWRALMLVGVVLLGAWPFAARRPLANSRAAWLAPGLLLPLALLVFDLLHGSDRLENSGLLAMAAALLLGLATLALREGDLAARTAGPTFAVATLGFLGLALARYLGYEVGLVTTALLGLSAVAVGLHYRTAVAETLGSGVALLASVGLLLGIARPNVYPAAGPLVWNWTSYMSGVVALGVLGAAALLRLAATRDGMPSNPLRPFLTVAVGLASVIAVFVWLNLQVLLHFETGDYIDLDLQPLQRRDLTMSIAWIAYALVLLALGMARGFAGLRQTSLVVLLVTLTKLFLRDLGELTGLYQVGAVAGLALSLLLVSLLYQRFVFPLKRAGEDGSSPGPPVGPGLEPAPEPGDLSEEEAPPRPE